MIAKADNSSASTDALFKGDMPKKLALSNCAIETSDHFVKKEWNQTKGKFDYIYPEDVEKKGRRTSKESVKASLTGDIPTGLKLSNVALGKSIEMEHKAAIKKIDAPGKMSMSKATGLIAKDHLKEDPKYYQKLKKMEAETADMAVETAGTYEPAGRPSTRAGDYQGGKKGRSWSWGDHKYRIRKGPKGSYRYDYSQNQRVPHTEAVVERKMKKEREKGESRAAHEGGMVRLPISGELQNPAKQASRPSAGFRGRAPSPRMAPQSKARHMQNTAVKGADVNIKGAMQGPGPNAAMQGPQGGPQAKLQEKQLPSQVPQQAPQKGMAQQKGPLPPTERGMTPSTQKGTVPASIMPGAGQHQQMQGIGNPANTGLNMPQNEGMKGFGPINTMADQAKSQGNVFNNNIIGREDPNKQNSSLNPLSKNNLTPEQQQRFAQSHDMAKQMSMKTGGQRFTTTGASANLFSITVNPDSTVFDAILGINSMPLERYLALIPYAFAPNP